MPRNTDNVEIGETLVDLIDQLITKKIEYIEEIKQGSYYSANVALELIEIKGKLTDLINTIKP